MTSLIQLFQASAVVCVANCCTTIVQSRIVSAVGAGRRAIEVAETSQRRLSIVIPVTQIIRRQPPNRLMISAPTG